MDNFASTALYNLIASHLQQLGMDSHPSPHFGGKIRRETKADLLNEALGSLGAASILGIGQGIKRLGSDPTLDVLIASSSPGDFLSRWQRLERYYHSKHRTRVVDFEEKSVHLEHYSTASKPPSAGEDLVIAGLVAALLQQVGCRELSMDIGEPTLPVISKDALLDSVDTPCKTARWFLRWESFTASSPAKRLPDATNSVEHRLVQTIASDLGRNWRVAEAADLLGLSKRSLQRSLTNKGTSFQKILRIVRVESAAELISSGGFNLVEAGYACGFSDQAHFSREFKLRINMSPSEFVDIAKTP